METPYETLNALKQIRTKLDEARELSQSLGTPSYQAKALVSYRLRPLVTLV